METLIVECNQMLVIARVFPVCDNNTAIGVIRHHFMCTQKFGTQNV